MNYEDKLNCHCGTVELEVETDLENIKQCNCSICKRKNAKMNLIPKDAIRIIKGEDNLSTYQFNTMKAEHFFAKRVVFIHITIEELILMVWASILDA